MISKYGKSDVVKYINKLDEDSAAINDDRFDTPIKSNKSNDNPFGPAILRKDNKPMSFIGSCQRPPDMQDGIIALDNLLSKLCEEVKNAGSTGIPENGDRSDPRARFGNSYVGLLRNIQKVMFVYFKDLNNIYKSTKNFSNVQGTVPIVKELTNKLKGYNEEIRDFFIGGDLDMSKNN